MKRQRAAAAAALWVWSVASGCSSLQLIPRSEYTRLPERHGVLLMTRDSLQYEFDYAVIARDTLIGYRRQDVGGFAPDYDSLAVALEDVERLASRRVDWYRTGLIGGVGVLAVAGGGLAKSAADRARNSNGSGGGGGRVP